MRILLLLSLLITSLTLSAQSLDDLKYDSIVNIPYSDFSLIYHKKKTAVWHEANFYVVKPTKNHFVYLESAELLVEVDTKKQNFYAIVTEPQTGGFKRFYIGNGVFMAQVFLVDGFQTAIKKDSLFLDKNLVETEFSEIQGEIGKIQLEIKNKNLFITDYKNPIEIIDYNLRPIESIQFPSEDSIDYSGTILYPPYNIQSGVEKSGVHNFKYKKWFIEPKYSQLIVYENKVLVSNELDQNKIDLAIKAYYGLYKINKKSIEILKDSIYTNDQYVVHQMTDYDSLLQLYNDGYYITHKNGKQGLINYQLFYKSFDYYEQTYNVDWINYTHNTLLQPISDFLYYSVGQDKSILKKGDYYSIIEHNNGDNPKTSDSLSSTIISQENNSDLNTNFGFNQINDSLVLIYDFIGEYHEQYPLVGYYGDDSITFNEYGEMLVVYPVPEPGQYHCGVYNLNQKKWVLNNEFYDVQYFGGSTILVQSPELDENKLITNTNNYNLYDLSGNLIEGNLTIEEITNSENHFNTLITNQNEKVTPVNLGFYSTCKNCDLEYKDNYYYVSKNNQYKIIETKIDESLRIDNLSDYSDFVWINRLQNIKIEINNNKLVLKYSIYDTTFIIENNNQIIEINIHTDKLNSEINKTEGLVEIISGENSEYYYIKKNKTIQKLSESEYSVQIKNYLEVIHFSKSENEIIISNENPSIKWATENYDDPDFGFQEISFEWTNENAVIWKKENGKWIIKSPFYNKIEKTNFGYIVKTGMCNMVKSENYDPFYEKYISSEFILMDSTLKPINIADYFNFSNIISLGFGYQIQYNEDGKYFLIDLNGKVLTDAIYDDFILENNKIYGINNEIIDIDEFGDEAYDEYGNLIILQKSDKILIGDL